MPPPERRALLLLLALAVAGQGVRHLATRPGEPPGQVQLLATLSPGSPLAQRDSAMRQARPLAQGERIDVDQAAAAELARLPRVGLALAKTIIADRLARGPFGGLEGLNRVSGVGPGLLKVLAPHVKFSGAGALWAGGQQGGGAVVLGVRGSQCSEASAPLPGCPAVRLNINISTAADLDALPGIGPAKAAAILQYREEHGPFTTVDQLARVPGFGAAAIARLKDRISVR
jgi:competence ComEA-like helix-hairpin-helix protein